jgi:hypothetical protein
MKWYLCEDSEEQLVSCDEDAVKMLYEGGKWTFRSGWYSSKEELYKDLGILDEPCKECGRLISTDYDRKTKEDMIARQLCFRCSFWHEIIADIKNPRRCIIDGRSYIVVEAPRDMPLRCRGFAGRTFKIEWLDGRKVITNNLWTNGPIPQRFLDRLLDNAKFNQNLMSCNFCKKIFDTLKEGKLRMGQDYCCLQCADSACKNFKP